MERNGNSGREFIFHEWGETNVWTRKGKGERGRERGREGGREMEKQMNETVTS